MKIKTFLSICLCTIATQQGLYAGDPKSCECGTHVTSITSYQVDGDDCCVSVALEFGYVFTYEPNGAAWELISSTEIAGSTAQSDCCPPG